MNLKKISLVILLIVIILLIGFIIFGNGKGKTIENSDKIKIVASNFASYDCLRAIIGNNENIELIFLIGPGKDAHGYDPTAQDLITIRNSDLFVYVGGKMEEWSEKVLESVDNTHLKSICISNDIETINEQEIDGVEKQHEELEGSFDEHIWTSPKNTITIVNTLEKAIREIDNANSNTYSENAKNYIQQIKEVDEKIQDIVDNRVRDRLIFADKMPMQYFINYYGLKVSAAFPGCSTDTEPSASTIAYLEKKVKEDNIPVVLYIELNEGNVARTIANEAGKECQAMQIQTLHNISKQDFENGETWVSLMNRNIDVLRKALQ